MSNDLYDQQFNYQMGEEEDTWPFVASIIYTSAWCISFYGQTYQNYKLKSVEGFNFDYLVLNLSGYTFYTIYSTVGYFTDIKGAGTVVVADLIFVYHAVAMIIFQLFQCFIYERGKNSISKGAIIVTLVLWLVVFVTCILYLTGIIEYNQFWNPISVLGYAKLSLTLIKYAPPAYWNYKRKSTKGWSIFNIILDLFGGVFSMASGGLSTDNGLNVTKVILAFITVFYDLIFCFQHYCLYRHKAPIQESSVVVEGTSLLTTNQDKSSEEELKK